jgi:prepilin-type processing-associated H-X9-DG protein
MEATSMAKAWQYDYAAGNSTAVNANLMSNAQLAGTDLMGFYCPTRRQDIRPGDDKLLLVTTWTGGGTDYGGCVGRHQAFLLDADQSVVLPSADGKLPLSFVPGANGANSPYKVVSDTSGPNATCDAKKGEGVFGLVNASTSVSQIRDGTSNTIMTGEMQRITTISSTGPFNANCGPVGSHDGWAIGGSPTLFTTGYPYPANAPTTLLMNNGHFMSPGSEHSNGANFGLADGSVTYLNSSIDSDIFALLGSMADRTACPVPPE